MRTRSPRGRRTGVTLAFYAIILALLLLPASR
jgi:hypothetical protein